MVVPKTDKSDRYGLYTQSHERDRKRAYEEARFIVLQPHDATCGPHTMTLRPLTNIQFKLIHASEVYKQISNPLIHSNSELSPSRVNARRSNCRIGNLKARSFLVLNGISKWTSDLGRWTAAYVCMSRSPDARYGCEATGRMPCGSNITVW
jgi:hypothetical protein